MSGLYIVVDRREDFRWPDPGSRVVTSEEYMISFGMNGRARIVNLCRDYGYLDAGYYVSLLADARGDRAVPDVRAFSEMDQRTFREEHAAALNRLLAGTPKMPRSIHSFSVNVYFGYAEDECFAELAGQAFARLRCPLLRIDLERAKPWRIVAKHAPDGTHAEGPTKAVAVSDVPQPALDAALQAARLIGRGLYGVDLKQTETGVYVMEVNDNPNLDVGMEDAALGDDLYKRLLMSFMRRAEKGHAHSMPMSTPERKQLDQAS